MKYWLLCDINSAYVSFCQLFNPQFDIDTTPLGVLSSNQGNIVARNNPLKLLGVKMGAPYFECKEQIEHNGGHCWGSNFELFGCLSSRFHDELSMIVADHSQYSVDEAFGRVPAGNSQELKEYAKYVQKTLYKNLGLRCGVGIGVTRTTAKLAANVAKDRKWSHHTKGIAVLNSEEKVDWVLKRYPASEIWGVGARTVKKLERLGVKTGYDLKTFDISEIKRQFNVVLARTVQELNGINAIELKEMSEAKDQICVSKSMGKTVTDINELSSAVSTHASQAAFKLRQQHNFAQSMQVFIATNSFRTDEPQHSQSISINFPKPTSDTSVIVKYAIFALRSIFKSGYKYKKTGVIIQNLSNGEGYQQNLFTNSFGFENTKASIVLDMINDKFGRGTIKTATEGFEKKWLPKDDAAPPSYTTNFDDLPIAKL